MDYEILFIDFLYLIILVVNQDRGHHFTKVKGKIFNMEIYIILTSKEYIPTNKFETKKEIKNIL